MVINLFNSCQIDLQCQCLADPVQDLPMELGDQHRFVGSTDPGSQAYHANQLPPVGVEVSDTRERSAGVTLTRRPTPLTCPYTKMVKCQWPANKYNC